ncbi:MAG: amidohydrolase, partial [Cyclobacteriaceae bacterium]|nr:amidohydrolase [Cyclobacteriaceae bacterium]
MSKAFTLILSLLLCIDIIAQETFSVNDVQDRRSESHAFINATIYVDHQTVYPNGTLLISEGKVVSVGTGIAVPEGYVVNDLKGKFIYPSFIDIYSDYGMPAVPRPPQFSFNRAEQLESDIPGA